MALQDNLCRDPSRRAGPSEIHSPAQITILQRPQCWIHQRKQTSEKITYPVSAAIVGKLWSLEMKTVDYEQYWYWYCEMCARTAKAQSGWCVEDQCGAGEVKVNLNHTPPDKPRPGVRSAGPARTLKQRPEAPTTSWGAMAGQTRLSAGRIQTRGRAPPLPTAAVAGGTRRRPRHRAPEPPSDA